MKLKFLPYILLLLTSYVLFSCADDGLYSDGGEREPVTLRLKVQLPVVSVMTRSDISGDIDRRVEKLWIGVYQADGEGLLTGSATLSPGKVFDSTHTMEDVDVETFTGRSYIVAVANYDNRYAMDADGKQMSLAEALEKADTWQKFQMLSVMWHSDGRVSTDVPLNPLLMSGHYIDGNHADGSYVQIQPVDIPKTGSLAGAIHLRRLVSHVRFNVGYNSDNIKNFEVIGWSLCKVPNQCWLSERNTETLNPGDVRTVVAVPSFQNTVESTIFDKTGVKWSFDWWQIENKRTGIDIQNMPTDPYQYREKEFKDATTGANTGKYCSLVTSADSDDPNNNATYVQFRVRMNLHVDEDGIKLPSGQSRVFDGVYTVHLGYCEGSGVDKAKDFNIRRNTEYTYNVKINNVNSVMVEADNGDENIPGAEGIVSDVVEEFVNLDAHYGVYNIHLTEEDLTKDYGQKTFNYLIRCYDENGALVEIDSSNPSTVPAEGSSKRKYLDWVELRSTSDAKTLSAYQPHTKGGTYRLDEFKTGLENGNIEPGWFTVFFNEYAYETSADGNESSGTAWRGYVNKPDRQIWIRVLVHRSLDGECSYFKSKYAFSQKSIQTYYDTSSTGSETAIGVEHINESYGLNLRTSRDESNQENGRYNVAQYLISGSKWNIFVDFKSLQDVNAINNLGVSKDATTYPVPALAAYTGDIITNSYDPDQSGKGAKFIEALGACANRNRDLNGDGKIDNSELRWYVPTTNQIIRVILGLRSLAKPIMDYSANSKLYKSTTGENPYLIVYGSDGKVVWCMEGTSTSEWGKYYSGTPWNVRCVRNLGTNMGKVVLELPMKPAFRRRSGDNNTGIVEMIYYDGKSIRADKMTRIIPHHIADQDYNRVYKAFEYSKPLTLGSLNGYNEYGGNWTDWLRTVNPCSGVTGLNGSGWRIPNQKEITIMMTFGITPATSYMPSATYSFYKNDGVGNWSNSNLNDTDYKVMCITNYGNATQQPYSAFSGSGTTVRCVRDVE